MKLHHEGYARTAMSNDSTVQVSLDGGDAHPDAISTSASDEPRLEQEDTWKQQMRRESFICAICT